MFTIGTYVEKTMNLEDNFCTHWDAGSYQSVYDHNSSGPIQAINKVGNKISGLRTRAFAQQAEVPTFTGEYPRFGI